VLARIHEFDHRQMERAQGSVEAALPLAKIEVKNLTTSDIKFLKECGIKA